MVAQARAIGYDSIELHSAGPGRASSAWSGLDEPAAARKILAEAGIELACLATELSLDWADRRTLDEHKTQLRHTLDLAARLGCPFVAIKSGTVPPMRSRDTVVQRIVENVRELAAHAAEHRVSLLIENSGNLAASRDLWYLLDAVGHPAVRGCWSPCHAQAAGDLAGLYVPRIGRSIAVTHMVDAVFTTDAQIKQFALVGQGQADLARFLVLMSGIGSDTHLIVNWPASASPPQDLLSTSLAWIKAQLTQITATPDLTAYKGDKNAPRYGSKAVAS